MSPQRRSGFRVSRRMGFYRGFATEAYFGSASCALDPGRRFVVGDIEEVRARLFLCCFEPDKDIATPSCIFVARLVSDYGIVAPRFCESQSPVSNRRVLAARARHDFAQIGRASCRE